MNTTEMVVVSQVEGITGKADDDCNPSGGGGGKYKQGYFDKFAGEADRV